MLRLRPKGAHEAMNLLKQDHALLRRLFDRFETTESTAELKEIVREACLELKVHAAVEERLFYPALRRQMEDADGLLDEADEEHHEVKILVAELELMRGDEGNYRAKFRLLSENVRHHMSVEETQLFPKARKTAIDFDALGEKMFELKRQATAEGMEPDAEARMVRSCGLAALSPSRKAQKTFSPPLLGRRRARKH